MRLRSSWKPSRTRKTNFCPQNSFLDGSADSASKPAAVSLKVKTPTLTESYAPVSYCQPPQVAYGDDLVAVIVGSGSSQREFILHNNLICAASSFFRRALAPPFMEHQTGIVKLPEESAEYFTAFYDWLYTDHPSKSVAAFLCGNSAQGWQTFWLDTFLLSDRLCVPGLLLCAWRQIKAMFNSRSPLRPSDELMCALHRSDMPLPAIAVREYIGEHVMYWHTKYRQRGIGTPWPSFKPPAKNIDSDAARALREGNKILTSIAAKVAKSDGSGCRLVHPSRKAGFERRYFLNVVELEQEARAYDQKGDGRDKMFHSERTPDRNAPSKR